MIKIRIRRDKLRRIQTIDVPRHQNRPGARMFHLMRVLGIGQKSQLRRPGLLHPGSPGNLDIAIPAQFTTQRRGNHGKLHYLRVNEERRSQKAGGRSQNLVALRAFILTSDF